MQLIDMLPDFYRGNQTMEKLQEVLSEQINALAANMNETIDQCFVNTATALLSRYEHIYGIQVGVSKSETFRREKLIARARGIGTVTKQMMEEVARSYTYGEVEVVECPGEYKFKIRFVGTKGLPPNMADLTLTIEEIKPAHLAFEYEFIYNTWADVAQMTWAEAAAFTWEELRTQDELRMR